MAKIQLHIDAADPADLADTLSSLMYLSAYRSDGQGVPAMRDAEGDEQSQAGVEGPKTRKPRKGADAQTAVQDSGSKGSATDVSPGTQDPAAPSPDVSAATDLKSQIAQVQAEEAAAAGAALSTEPTKENLTKFMTAHMAKHSPVKTQEVLQASAGAKRISEIDPAKYGDAIAALQLEL